MLKPWCNDGRRVQVRVFAAMSSSIWVWLGVAYLDSASVSWEIGSRVTFNMRFDP